jgi:uncharacterized RDD family membrane protein YckC
MSSSLLFGFGFVLLPGITLGLAYHPILARLSLALVSPYAKAPVEKRALAATIDGLLVATMLVLYLNSAFLPYLLIGALYLLLRDAVAGRSVGKFLCGLVVINLKTGRPCGRSASISRNAFLLLPGANVVAAFLEAATIARDPQGQRLGDRLAWTQVIEGYGAKDVVAAVQAWWLDFVANLDGNPRTRRRAPVRTPR